MTFALTLKKQRNNYMYKLYLQHEDTGNIISIISSSEDYFSIKYKDKLKKKFNRYYIINKGRYTGLEDINGKYIFCHDILKIKGDIKCIGIVRNDNENERNINNLIIDWGEINGIKYHIPEYAEIIGNKFENAYLLNIK